MIRLRPSGADEVLIKRVRDWYEPGPGVFIEPQALFSPAMLFTGTTTGAWYDPSDITTLYRDAAGTAPVTGVEQPVGLMLDKSKGLVLGPELVTNGDFSNGTTGWLTANCAQAVTGEENTITANGTSFPSIYRSFSCNVGKTYVVTATVRKGSGASQVGIQINGIGGSYTSSTTNTGLRYQFTATLSSHQVAFAINGTTVNGDTATVDNISVRELPGNHAFNSSGNSANFPVLSARYNLLTKTEDFSDAAWTKTRCSINANAITAPDGTLTADKLIEDSSASTTHAIQSSAQTLPLGNYTGVFYGKAAERTWAVLGIGASTTGIAYFDLLNGLVGTVTGGYTASIQSVGNGWFKCTLTGQAAATLTNPYAIYTATGNNGGSYTGDGTSGIYIWGADLRVANDVLNQPVYQRVNTATDYDTVGFKPYLKFNGTNQWLQTNSIDFTYGDKMFVSAGVRHLSNANYGGLVGLGATVATAGSFLLWTRSAAGTGGFEWYSNGNATGNITESATPALPRTSVVSTTGDISLTGAANELKLRINGSLATTTAAGDCGTGNYANAVITIGSYNASNFFNGRLHQLVVAGKQASASEISSTETYLNQKTGAY